jgi:hypothetical protein
MSSPDKNLDRDALIRLVQHIMTTSGCVVDVDGLISTLEANVPHPDPSGLIFNPPTGRAMTATEIVDIAMKETR